MIASFLSAMYKYI